MRSVSFAEIRTSALGFGCGSVMGRVGRRDSLRAMHAAWDLGITLFDTARSYGYGEAEALLGYFLEGRRHQATIVTKFGILPSRSNALKRLAKPAVRAALGLMPSARGLVRRNIASELSPNHFDLPTLQASLEASLRALRTDFVDILLLHEPPASVLQQDDLLAALDDLIRQGKVRRTGLSTTPEIAQLALNQTSPDRPNPGALQIPAGDLTLPRPGLTPSPNTFLMANHPFGGPERARQLASALADLSRDPTTPANLRDKLHAAPRQLAAQLVFSHILHTTAFHAILPSMLYLENLRANAAAIDAIPFTPQECQTLASRISNLAPRT